MTGNNYLTENSGLFAILQDIPVGMLLLDDQGQIIMVNKAFLKLTSYVKKDIIGKAIGEILIPPAEGKKKSFDFFLSEGSSSTKPIAGIKNKEGKVYRVEFRLYDSLSEPQKLYAGFVIEPKDSDDLKNELDRQIVMKETAQDKLEEEGELSDLKSRFLSIASHEFRTPLAGIVSSINLITRYLEADQGTWSQFRNREKVVNHIKKVNESVKNLTTILDRFLALGNIEQGEIPLRMTRFNIERALKTQSKQFQELCKPGQNITYRHKGGETSVYLDKNLLKNIMNNLFSNAIRFSEENAEIKLYTEVIGNEISIELSDEGIGIPKADQNNIFRRFYRAKNALAFQDGTGLGLSIVKKYVDLMNGNISFDSEENTGTTFYITFPNKTQ